MHTHTHTVLLLATHIVKAQIKHARIKELTEKHQLYQHSQGSQNEMYSSLTGPGLVFIPTDLRMLPYIHYVGRHPLVCPK